MSAMRCQGPASHRAFSQVRRLVLTSSIDPSSRLLFSLKHHGKSPTCLHWKDRSANTNDATEVAGTSKSAHAMPCTNLKVDGLTEGSVGHLGIENAASCSVVARWSAEAGVDHANGD
jgi:hypothetical protein